MADINSIVLPDGTEYPVSDYYLPVAISNPTAGQVLKYDAENDVWYNGDDAEGSSVFYGTSAPTSQLGVNGNLYVKYTEGTGGASDTVDALYVKLDDSWCQISTGGGGGTSDYEDLTNKPQINSVELSGNKSLDDLGIQPSEISKTATGSIVTFSDGGDNIPVESFECEIVAQQASGTPTPASPFPITGHSESDIVVCGKNLLDSSTLVQGGISGTGIDTVSNVRVRSGYFYLPSGDYIIKSDVYIDTINFYSSGDSSTFISRIIGSSSQISFTLTSGCYVRIAFRKSNTRAEITPNEVTNTQLEEGSTATTYEPYKGNIYTVAFGQTIYGGKLIYANGKWSIEATHGCVDLGSLSWNYRSSGSDVAPYFYALISGVKFRGVPPTTLYDIMCETYKPTKRTVSDFVNDCITFDGSTTAITQIQIKDSAYTDPITFTSSLSGVKFVHELETPVIIPITSATRVKTISGDNNIFSNTGDSTLKYFTNDADGIEELINTSETSAENTTIDDTNLAYEANNAQEAFEKITKSLTWAEYQALSDAEKNNGTAYFITDVNGNGQNFQPVIYSEEEREIGVWTDGKPLYEKTLINTTDVSTSNNAWSSVSWSNEPSNIDKFINAEIHSVHEPNVSAIFRFSLENGHIVVASKELTTFLATDKVTIRYTKTTDVAGSGIWTPQGIPAVHYSTDEHIVGTWIDGSTIYEKIFIAQVTSTAYTIDVSDLNIDEVISNTAFIKQTTGNTVTAPYGTNQNDFGISYYSSNLIKFSYAGVYNATTWYVTIRYTKSS